MKYNFDEIVDRSKNNAVKYLEMEESYGSNNLIPLWIADMDFRTAPCVMDALKERVEQGIFGYTNRPEEYWERIRDWQLKRNGYAFDTKLMSYAPGVIPGIRMMLELFAKPEDKVIIQEPVYYPFSSIIRKTGHEIVVSNLINDNGRYTMDYADFEEKVSKGDVKYFILCNPHNPVGRCWTKEELKKIGDICVKHNVEIFSDEIHSDLILYGNKHTCMASVSPEIAKITITNFAASKTFNLAGLMASTIVFNSPEKKAAYDKYIGSQDIERNNCFSLVATISAYKDGEDWVNELCKYITDNMTFLKEFIDREIPELKMVPSEATYLAWIDAGALGMNDKDLIKFCAEKAGIAPGIGVNFGHGGEGHLRINTACPRSVLEKAFTQLRDAIRNR